MSSPKEEVAVASSAQNAELEKKKPEGINFVPKLVTEWPEGEHPLQTSWSFWYDKKMPRQSNDNYQDNLTKLGTFSTIEGFFRFYAYLTRAHDLPRDVNIHLFRAGAPPMWESFPNGGCWILRVKKKAGNNSGLATPLLTKLWENLALACITEQFEEPDVMGIVLSTRTKEDLLSIWNRSNENSLVRFRIGDKMRDILDLDPNTLIQYKEHIHSMKDGSTFRNATAYMFAPTPTLSSTPANMMNIPDISLSGPAI
eukprot:GILI01002184.1.p2 GENE.GILI01002184.1~~GILI01002184.1.p2  ORF type:complete len:255 (+),score=92.93 GILI01002184.1:61-825(+)